MKLFPHILGRVGGTTFDNVRAMSFGEMEVVNILLQKERKLANQFEIVLKSFQNTLQKANDYRLKAILINVQKDFMNHRSSVLKKLKKINEDEILKELIFDFSIYSNLELELYDLKKDFELIYQDEKFAQYNFLKDFFALSTTNFGAE